MIGLVLLTAITLAVTVGAVGLVFVITEALFSGLAYLFTDATLGGIALGIVIGVLCWRMRKEKAADTEKTAEETTETTKEIFESRNNGTGCMIS